MVQQFLEALVLTGRVSTLHPSLGVDWAICGNSQLWRPSIRLAWSLLMIGRLTSLDYPGRRHFYQLHLEIRSQDRSLKVRIQARSQFQNSADHYLKISLFHSVPALFPTCLLWTTSAFYRILTLVLRCLCERREGPERLGSASSLPGNVYSPQFFVLSILFPPSRRSC